jgi:hypothetical protein
MIIRHCERSKAIQFDGGAGLPRRFAPRNDDPMIYRNLG